MDIRGFFDRAAKRTGFRREYYLEQNLPTSTSDVMVIPSFGDYRTTFVLSSFLLHRLKEKNQVKYMIVASWPGMRGLFPYADEYWSPIDNSVTRGLASEANCLYNGSGLAMEINRGFLEVFSNVGTLKDLRFYYDEGGFTDHFWKELTENFSVYRFLPEVPSETMIADQFRKQVDRREGRKLFVFPNRKMRTWQRGKTEIVSVPRNFWTHFIGRLLNEGFVPVVYLNEFTYDVSTDFADRCVYLVPSQVSDILCAMAYVGCVLDVFSGISRLSIAARTPFVALDERSRFVGSKDYEIDDLACGWLPKQYLFSFATLLLSGTEDDWDTSLLNGAVAKLKRFNPPNIQITNRENMELISNEVIRKNNARRLGVHFIRTAREKN